MRVLIVADDPLHRGALAASRALKRAGWTVGVGSPQRRTLVSWSRSVTWRHHLPSPHQDLDAFLQGVQEAQAHVGYDVILPADDAEVLALSFGRSRIQAAVPYPPHAEVVRAFDKYELAISGKRAGLATPETTLATDDSVTRARFPIAVKSRLHWTPGVAAAPRRWETSICSNIDEVVERVEEIRAVGGEALLQELVQGPILSLSLVVDGKGEVAACVQQLGDPLTWPPGAGIRVRLRSVAVDADLRRKTESLLRDLRWVGFANLQFIVSADRGPLLVDFNGRIVQSFEHAIAVGGNLADMWARVATGKTLAPAPAPLIGMRFQWFEGDLKRALAERRGGLVRDVFGCVVYAFGSKHDFWRWDDPWPAVRYWAGAAKRSAKKLRRGRAEAASPELRVRDGRGATT